MKITACHLHRADVPLSRPYAVASHANDTARMALVRLATDGAHVGVGAATPEPEVNGDTGDAAFAGLQAFAERFVGRAVEAPAAFAPLLAEIGSPGARAAFDIALHDLHARTLGRPLVEVLGRAHTALPTSVTIGVRDVAATLAEAREYLARGFRVLKVKIGVDVEIDVERLVRLRELIGCGIAIRVDGNVGYGPPQLLRFLQATRDLGIEFIEQPLPRTGIDAQRVLPAAVKARLMADESLHDVADARVQCREPRAFGLFNIKLMKCGGVLPARAIAALADDAGIGLMWGCMDESRIAIAAALHAALSCPATRYLDLDGHLDLSRDFASGGFDLTDGVLRTLDRPGLGVTVDAPW